MTDAATLSEPGLPHRLALFMDGLCGTVAKFGARHRARAALMLLLWSYLRRTTRRLNCLIARFNAGRLGPVRTRPAQARPTTATSRQRLPQGAAWLGQLGWEFRVHASQLQHMLDHDPDLRALLAAEPGRAGRLLGPLCRMLSVTPGLPPLRRRPGPSARPPRLRPDDNPSPLTPAREPADNPALSGLMENLPAFG